MLVSLFSKIIEIMTKIILKPVRKRCNYSDEDDTP